MKTIFKISTVLFVGLTLVVSSCKKEEVLIDGCTDINAMNYQDLATNNNGSCVFAYDIILGSWNIDPDCEEIDVLGQTILLNDQLPEFIDVQGAEANTLFIYIGESPVSGTIDNSGSITVVEQTVSIDVGLGIPIPVQISGLGKVESETDGYINLTFSGEIDLIPGLPTAFSSTCYIALSK
jgi:hypothetical protein